MAPHPEVLSRDLTEKKRVLDIFAGLLEATVDFGTHLFTWCLEAKPVERSNLVIGLLLHQFIETIDGPEVLVRQGATEPMKLVLRSALESFLGLLYILEADTDRRARCYRVTDVRRRIKVLLQHDLATPQGKEYRAEIAKDTSGFSASDETFLDTSKDVAALEHALDNEVETREIHAEWKAVRKRIGGNPHWYSLFGGPENLRDLAVGLGFAGWYRVLYAEWSGTMHGEDALARMEIDVQSKEGHVRGLRHPEALQVLTSIGTSMAVKLYERIVRTRVPDREPDFGLWYAGVREPYRMVADPEPMIRFRTEAETPKT